MVAMAASDIEAHTSSPRVSLLDLPDELLRLILGHVEARAVEPTYLPTSSDGALLADPYFYRLQHRIDEYTQALPLVFSDIWAVSRCNHRLRDIAVPCLYRQISAHLRESSDAALRHARLQASVAEFGRPTRYTIDLVRKADRHLIESVAYAILGDDRPSSPIPIRQPLLQDLFALPKIERLTVSALESSGARCIDFDRGAHASNVKHLRLIGPDDETSDDQLLYIMRRPTALESLYLHANMSIYDLQSALEPFTTTLRRLSLAHYPCTSHIGMGREEIGQLDVRSFEALEVLEVHDVFIIGEAYVVFREHIHDLEIWKRLPKSLRHLSLYYNDPRRFDFRPCHFEWLRDLARNKAGFTPLLENVNIASCCAFSRRSFDGGVAQEIGENRELFEEAYDAYQESGTVLTVRLGVSDPNWKSRTDEVLLMCTDEKNNQHTQAIFQRR